ncbi:MAG TPA: diacylglycerol kinase family protein [Silvibacterium sp.]|nr:diacylglycerol kinase family protein [Silvibacterium sp.]
MRKAALLYNPDSGGSQRRRRDLESAVALLRQAGVEAELLPTESRDHAGEEARAAIAGGCDTIFACGGDGTIHNIAQVVANTPVALGVLPMGTANALAHDLGLPNQVPAAAEAALHAEPRRIALGRVGYRDLKGNPASRYFVVAAGMGVDAHLFYRLLAGDKRRMGMAAYYAKAWNLWFTYAMTRFVAEYWQNGSNKSQRADVTEIMAVRIRNFGGVLRELAPGAALDRNDVRLVVCRTASRMAYLGYVTRGLLGQQWTIPGIDLVHATRLRCVERGAPVAASRPRLQKIYVEADGELLGTIPAEITIVPNAMTLLAPRRR